MKLILNEDLFLESKADEQKLIDFAGEDLAKQFLQMKQRLKSPENDIYYWLKKSPEELKNRLDELSSVKTRKEKENTAREGAELVAENDYYKVYHITTYEASVKYGKHTQWCISGSKRWSNGEKGEEYFNDYTSKGIQFYFFIPKTDENEKYALASQNKVYQIFNEIDDEVYEIPKAPDLKGIYSPPKYTYIDGMAIKGTVVAGYDKNKLPDKVIIPNNITSIGDHAFASCAKLTEIIIPDNVTYIEDHAFQNCIRLEQAIIPDSVIYIGGGAFMGCKNLKKVIYKGEGNMFDHTILESGNDPLINAYKQTINN